MKTTDEIRREEEAAEVEDYSGFYDKHRAERAEVDPSIDAIHKATADVRATICIELAHREALAAEAIKNDINAKLAANGYTANGEAIKRE